MIIINIIMNNHDYDNLCARDPEKLGPMAAIPLLVLGASHNLTCFTLV
jgi:hypothetical protein